ncbi:MAG TPA: 1,3-beta-glucanase, partial [Mycobacterium sp.]|nr:1,3-beta-glucanase [Mycobacterium sp.]
MNRRNMLLTTGMGMLAAAAAVRGPEAHANPTHAAPPAAPSAGPAGPYIFQDEFDGPAGQGPDLSKWTIQTWQDDVFPPVAGIYRSQNVFLDGNSNLVLLANQE